MSTRLRALVLATIVLATSVLVLTARPADAYEFPSTNDANRAVGQPHVNLVSRGPGSVTLEFVNSTNSLAFFEYRIDGRTEGTEPHPVVIGDVIHPGVCVDGRTPPACSSEPIVRTFEASTVVDVRLALGGERDWDFDWTPFTVGKIRLVDCLHGGWRDLGFRSVFHCLLFVFTGIDTRCETGRLAFGICRPHHPGKA